MVNESLRFLIKHLNNAEIVTKFGTDHFALLMIVYSCIGN